MTIFRRLVLTLLICLILFGVAVFAILAWQRENELRDAEAQTATREMSRLLSISPSGRSSERVTSSGTLSSRSAGSSGQP